MKALLLVLSVLALAAAGGGWYWQHSSKPNITFRTTEVKRGELLATISATGTIEPMDVIDVGAQVAGRIVEFGKDKDGKDVDYGSNVTKGMRLAHIDDLIPKSDLLNAKAQLSQAEATLQHSNADLERLKALSAQADAEWKRVQKFPHSEALAQNDYDTFEANQATAKANLAVGDAAILQAMAGVEQANAQIPRAKANYDYCEISSPVNGVIIDRRVNIGQTVVSGLSAPSLFLIAENLKQMQLWVAVNEADVGSIHPGQNVTFTVDAFAGETFKGTVNKVRLNATMTQNVVTYTVEVNTDNKDLKLMPYLTANVQFEVKKDENVLLVPNAALRWYPQPQSVAPDVRAQFEVADAKEAAPADKPAAAPSAAPAANGDGTTPPKKRRHGGDAEKIGTLWVQDGQYVRPVTVTVGPTDTINTEVASADLKDGAQVIVGEIHEDDASSQTTNPFAPQMFRRGGRGGGGGRGR
ncbi:MAG TPA: efflux RND transporter periplasmic adaptor subunit [Tepidisphaeraceae bacterium]|jgi:HlyD family secretion protein